MFADNDGPYYWHIKSGTIQRDPPDGEGSLKNEPRTPLVKDVESVSLLPSHRVQVVDNCLHIILYSHTADYNHYFNTITTIYIHNIINTQ